MPLPKRICLPDGLEEVVRFGEVIRFVHSMNLDGNDIAYLDLSKVAFISPYGLLGLLFLGKDIYDCTGNKIHLLDKKDKLIQYLERMDFFEVGNSWFNKPTILAKEGYKFSRSEQTTSLLEIQKIGTTQNMGKFNVDTIVSKFRQRASQILDTFQEKMDVNFFIKVMTELCTNVYTHSQSDGYVAIQRYKYERRGFEVVKLTVMDDGIGIKSSLDKRYDFRFPSEVDYIKKALEPNISGAGDRGFGLCAVKSIVEQSSGYLWINSGRAAVLLGLNRSHIHEYLNLPFLKGTRIAIILAFEPMTFSIDNEKEDSLYF